MTTTRKFPSVGALPSPTRFVVVNDRMPRSVASCGLCCKKIEQGYIRELQTGLVYCGPACLSEHQRMVFVAIEDRERKVS